MLDQNEHLHVISKDHDTVSVPHNDPRVWAHAPQALSRAFLDDEATGLIVDVDGNALTPDMVLDLHNGLVERGIQTGDVVLVKAENALMGVAGILATWMTGATVCPVDPSASNDVVDLIGSEIQARALIETDGSLHLTGHTSQSEPWRARDYATGEDLGLVIFTSGSSGRPKGVMLSNTNIMTALRAIASYLAITPKDRVLCIPPMFLDYGIYQVLFHSVFPAPHWCWARASKTRSAFWK